jgi:hypothetical protein
MLADWDLNMPFARVIFSLALSVVVAAVPAAAQEVITERALSLDLAQGIAEAALAKCRADGNHVSVTVLDRDGLIKAVLRDDGSGPTRSPPAAARPLPRLRSSSLPPTGPNAF